MSAVLLAAATAVLASVLVSLIRVARGPSVFDRMLAAQIFGSGGVAVLLLLSHAIAAPALIDVALVVALLSAVAGIALVRRSGAEDAR